MKNIETWFTFIIFDIDIDCNGTDSKKIVSQMFTKFQNFNVFKVIIKCLLACKMGDSEENDEDQTADNMGVSRFLFITFTINRS